MIVRAAGVRLATLTPPLSSPHHGQIRKQKVRSSRGLYPPESDVLANQCRRRRRNRVAAVVVRKHGVEHSCRRTVVMAASAPSSKPARLPAIPRRRRRRRSSQPTARPHRRLHPHRLERRLNGRLQQLIIDRPAMGAPSPTGGHLERYAQAYAHHQRRPRTRRHRAELIIYGYTETDILTY